MLSPTFRSVPAKSLHVSRPIHWLSSRFHFSFADHYDPSRMSFGVLRVLNDDIVTANEGFPPHPHRDMEILSYIVDGELTHGDSGTRFREKETLGRYGVQFMSAGLGVRHSEMNEHDTDPCRFLQIWIVPDKRGHAVRYGSRKWTKEDRWNKLQHIAKPDDNQDNGRKDENDDNGGDPLSVIKIHQDVNFFASEIDDTARIPFEIGKDRQAYIICIEGKSLDVSKMEGGISMKERDGLKVRGPATLEFATSPGVKHAHFLMIEMKRGDDDEWQK